MSQYGLNKGYGAYVRYPFPQITVINPNTANAITTIPQDLMHFTLKLEQVSAGSITQEVEINLPYNISCTTHRILVSHLFEIAPPSTLVPQFIMNNLEASNKLVIIQRISRSITNINATLWLQISLEELY
jgi:hypothetical protein